MDVFDREMQKEGLFADRNILSSHFVPEILPHREKEIDKIMTTLAPVLKAGKVHNLFLYGKTGTGKTACTKHVITKLNGAKEKYNAKVDSIYINCRILNTKYQVMMKCANYCEPNVDFLGYPFVAIYESFKKYINDSGTAMIVVLDELDKLKDVDELMYTLTRINDELEKGYCSLIAITNNVNLKDQLDPRSRSSLCEDELIFAPYNADQLHDIIEKRIKVGFKENVFPEPAIALVSALAAQESGDARYALKLVSKAGELAESKNKKFVEEQDIKDARTGVEDEIVADIMETLPGHQKYVLYAIAQLSMKPAQYTRLGEAEAEKSLFSGDVYDKYRYLCKKFGTSARSARWVREYVNDLEMLGLITTKLSGKGIRGSTTLIKLDQPIESVISVLEKAFNKVDS